MAKDYDIFSAATALHFGDGVEIDDDGAVNANEGVGRERGFEVADFFADGEDAGTGVDADIIAGGLDPLDFGVTEKDDLALGAYDQAATVAADAAQEGDELFLVVVVAGFAGLDGLSCAGKRFEKAFPLKRFQQVIDGVGVEGFERVLVVGGDEDDSGKMQGRDGFEDAEAIGAGHLHVEKDEIGAVLGDGADGGGAVSAIGDDVEAAIGRQQREYPPARQGFVVHDQSAYGHRDSSPFAAEGSEGESRC